MCDKAAWVVGYRFLPNGIVQVVRDEFSDVVGTFLVFKLGRWSGWAHDFIFCGSYQAILFPFLFNLTVLEVLTFAVLEKSTHLTPFIR